MKLLRPSFLLLGMFVIGGIVFKLTSPNDCDFILNSDSIFVLTGDFRRVPFALRQVEKYPDADLYVIGAGPGAPYIGTERAIIESESKSTYQNALAIRDIVEKSGLDRIVVITTEDHIQRATFLIKSELPETQIVSCPVALHEMRPARRLERWMVEYVKFLVTMIGIREGPESSYK